MKAISREPIMEMCNLAEALAKLEHEQWSHWIRYMNSIVIHGETTVEFANGTWKRWLQLADTPYEKLTKEEKRSDIQWARKVFAIIPKLCPMLEQLRKMLKCSECRYYKRCLKMKE